MTDTRTLYVVIVALIAALLVSSTIAGLYLLKYDQAEENANTYLDELNQAAASKVFSATTDILLDFGNGTLRWFNDTQVQPGWNVYIATVVITKGNMNATWYPQYGEHLINGIDGVQNTASSSWFLFSYNSTTHWQVAQEGADDLSVYNGTVFAWDYCGVSSTYTPTCPSP